MFESGAAWLGLTDGRPGRRLPDVIELPVEGAHGVTFALDHLAATSPVELRLKLHTLSLRDLMERRPEAEGDGKRRHQPPGGVAWGEGPASRPE